MLDKTEIKEVDDLVDDLNKSVEISVISVNRKLRRRFACQLAEQASVSISIYDMSGKIVRTLELGERPAGVYLSKDRAVYWDGRNNEGEKVSSGLYFYHLRRRSISSQKGSTSPNYFQ